MEKRKKRKEKGSDKLVKKFCLRHTGGENSTQNFFGGGGKKSNFRKNIHSHVSQKRYPSEKPF